MRSAFYTRDGRQSADLLSYYNLHPMFGAFNTIYFWRVDPVV